MVAVFDTAFHHTLPAYAAQYLIPHNRANRYHIRRYGFHGIAHRYMSERYAMLTATPEQPADYLTTGQCCSATAIAQDVQLTPPWALRP
jgi:acetate kinase